MRLERIDKTGALIFCRPYSYALASGNLRWTVSITRGVQECR